MKIYLVGGAVRDELLGLPIKERDYVVVGSTPQAMLAQGFTGVGKSFPVFLHPETKEEYALARTERKIGPGYHGFEFETGEAVTLEEDLMRRDLTINAIAKADDGTLIDPYGGVADLNQKILRHVSPAFIEDPVRVLRIARFAARFAHLGFTVAPETIALMQQMVQQGELNHLVSERVWKELEQALKEQSPWVFIQTLRACGALKVILPEIDALYGVPQPLDSHPEKDVGIHIEMVLQQAARLTSDPVVRFAALVHDVGKGLTPQEQWPHHPNHEASGESLIRQLCKRLRPPMDFQQMAMMVTKLHGECYNANKFPPEQLLQLLEQCDVFRRPERFTQLLLACAADYKGRPGYEDKPYPNREFLEKVYKAAVNVDPKTVIASSGMTDGPQIKQAIAAARIKAIADAVDQKN